MSHGVRVVTDAADVPVGVSDSGGSTGLDGAHRSPASRAPQLAVVATVVVAFVIYALLGSSIDAPRAFSDELLYFDAAAAVVAGDGLTIRGEPYRYGPLYPALLVPIHWIAPDRKAAYELAKILNALLFALTAIPVFLLAARVLPAWPSAAAAALSVAIPSATYVSVVMTESLAYLTFAWTLYAIVRALERPSVLRQSLALLAILVATGVRTQFLLLFGVYVVGLVLVPLITPARGTRRRATFVSLWPTWASLGLGLGAVLLAAALGSRSSASVLGNYSVLVGTYDPVEVGQWLIYHLANIELYLAVVPVAVAPIAIASMFVRGRQGSRRHAAFLVLFLTANGLLLLLTAAFNTTKYAGDVLHDRPLFYVIPLWLILLFVWISSGMARPLTATVVGGAIAMTLPLTLPFAGYARGNVVVQFEAAPTALWVAVDEVTRTIGVSGVIALVLFTLILVLATLLLPSRFAYLFPALVLVVFVMTAELSWFSAASWAESRAKVPRAGRLWLDEHVPPGHSVTLLTKLSRCVTGARDAFYLSEFFNSSVQRAAHLGEAPDALPRLFVNVDGDGQVVTADDAPFVADYVVTQPRIRLAGRRVVEGADGRLVLWEIAGPVRVIGADSARELDRLACLRPPR